jgi:hypothetical protein
VAAAQHNTVVVVESGTPVLMPWVDSVRAVLEAWYPGQEGGAALAAVLFGDVNPSGRLPVTFPEREADTPFAGHPERYPGIGDNALYSEGVFVGYRWYDEHGIDPLFAFGHGLSYAAFEYADLRVGDGTVSAAVTTSPAARARRWRSSTSPPRAVPRRSSRASTSCAWRPARPCAPSSRCRARRSRPTTTAGSSAPAATGSWSGGPRATCRCARTSTSSYRA